MKTPGMMLAALMLAGAGQAQPTAATPSGTVAPARSNTGAQPSENAARHYYFCEADGMHRFLYTEFFARGAAYSPGSGGADNVSSAAFQDYLDKNYPGEAPRPFPNGWYHGVRCFRGDPSGPSDPNLVAGILERERQIGKPVIKVDFRLADTTAPAAPIRESSPAIPTSSKSSVPAASVTEPHPSLAGAATAPSPVADKSLTIYGVCTAQDQRPGSVTAYYNAPFQSRNADYTEWIKGYRSYLRKNYGYQGVAPSCGKYDSPEQAESFLENLKSQSKAQARTGGYSSKTVDTHWTLQ